MSENLYLDAQLRLSETTALIRELEDAKQELDRRIGDAESREYELKKRMKSAEGFESWLTSRTIPFTRFIETDNGVVWWLLKIDERTGTFALFDRGQYNCPMCPCLCCHESMGFSPYDVDHIDHDGEEIRYPEKGFRKDWSEPLLLACKSLGCTRLEVMGLDNAQRAQVVTPLPIEWCGESNGFRELILPPLYRS